LHSTDNAAFSWRGAAEVLEFQIGPVGTTWTNYSYNGDYTRKVTIEAIENASVPAGTFPCYKFHKQVLEVSGSDWYEWVCPKLGLIQWVDYWVDPSETPPITYRLQSVGPRP
jgi:hypothetical protein